MIHFPGFRLKCLFDFQLHEGLEMCLFFPRPATADSAEREAKQKRAEWLNPLVPARSKFLGKQTRAEGRQEVAVRLIKLKNIE